MNNQELDKKIKLYEKLGAVKFQKLVFKVERLKFKVVKKLFPNSIKYFDRIVDFRTKRAIKRAKTEEEKNKIKRNSKIAKMGIRKEMNTEQNRNYHIDPNKPTEILQLLEWNKDIHKKGLIKDAIVIPVLIGGVILNIPIAIPLLVLEIFSAGINFECINIQNYNICRFKKIEPALRKREERRLQKQVEEYGEATEVIGKTIEKSESLPSYEEIIDNIDSKEQLEQMKELLRAKIEERQKSKQLIKKTKLS